MSLVSNPVVRVGLEDLAKTINLPTGLGNVRDRGAAVGLFLLLKKNNESWDPQEIHDWAMANGWTERGVEDLTQLARDVNEGKKVRPERHWSPDAIDRLRAQARRGG